MKRILILFLFVASVAGAAIVPSAQTIDWSQSGIVGGIPVRTTIGQTADAATYGNDSTAALSHLQAKINATPSGQVCYIPAGTYRISGTLVVPSNITIRGAGEDQTIIKSVGATGNGAFAFGTDGSTMQYSNMNTYSTTITSGNTAGSTSIVVASATGISAGDIICVTGLNDGTVVTNTSYNGTANWVDGWGAATGYTQGSRNRGQMVKVTAVAGTTLTLAAPGLYTAYATPWVTRMFAQGPELSGVEDLTVYSTNSGSTKNFYFNGAEQCWLYRVKGNFTDGDHVDVDWSYRCEIRKSHFIDGFIHTSGSYDNGIFLRLKSAGCLVVDNIVERSHISICAEWGAAGNVIAYNYTLREYDSSESGGNRALQMGISINHGAHPQFNLVEGNVTDHIIADSFWGTSSDNLIFRNWVRGHSTSSSPYDARGAYGSTYELTQARRMIDIWDGQTKVSVVGNILGDSFTGTGSGTTHKITSPTSRPYDSQIYEWSIGYATTSDSGGLAILTSPTATLIDHGNYSHKTASQTWDAVIADHSLPDSFFLSGKPDWFYGLTWPAFNPASPGALTTPVIPAWYRYNNAGADPPAGGGDSTPPTISSVTVGSDGTTVTVVFSEAVTRGAGWSNSLMNLDGTVTNNLLSYASFDGTTTWTLTSASTIYSGESLNFDFPTTANAVEDAAGNDLAAVTDGSVTNNSSQISSVVTPSRARRGASAVAIP